MAAAKTALAILAALFCLASGHAQTGSRAPNSAPAPSLERLLSQAGDSLTAGRYEEAVSRFHALLKRSSDMPEAFFGLGVACSQLGRLKEAREALESYVKLRPLVADGHSALGMVLLAVGSRAGAKAELARALRLEPRNFEVAKALAHVETEEFNGAGAVVLLRPFAASPEFDDEARRLLAAGYAQSGDHRAALATLGPMLDRQPPPPPEVFVLVAGSALRAGDTAFAEHACDLGLRAYLNSDEIGQRCLQVVSMSFVNRLESKLRGSAQDVPTLILMARLLAEIADSTDETTRKRCIGLLERAVALSSSDPVALYNLGRGLRVLAHPEQAIPLLERALGARPNEELQALIWTQTALAEQDLRRDAQAESAFDRAFQLNRGLTRHLVTSAYFYYTFLVNANKEQRAAAVLGEILRWDPFFLPARMKHARMLSDEGRMEEAAEEAELIARNADPADSALLRVAHIFLLQLYTKMERADDAARHRAWLRNTRTASEP